MVPGFPNTFQQFLSCRWQDVLVDPVSEAKDPGGIESQDIEFALFGQIGKEHLADLLS